LINAGRLNDYLKNHMSDLSAKVFRTYNASITLQNQLEKKAQEQNYTAQKWDGIGIDEKFSFYNACNRDVAILCNHKKTETKGAKESLDKMA
jgi:DNA topoisomerase I